MSGFNKVILIGNLGQDPEVKFLEGGRARTNFTLATSERWADKNSGEKKERTEWHKVVIWGKTGELSAQYLTKGSQVCVEGHIQTRKWQDKEGHDRYTTEVVATNVTFIGNKPNKQAA